MDVKNHNMNKEKPIMRKRLKVIAFLAFFLGIVLAVSQYFGFVSKTVYEESVSHLTEVFHQSDNMLRELSNKNLTYLHMWSKYLQDAPSESKIRDYIDKAQKDAGFLYFYFLSADGNYKMTTGETGYLGLQENIEDEIQKGNDIITNAAVPGKSQMLVFASPKAHGSYQGFKYDAIAIAYENADIVNVLDISAFNGKAKSYVLHPDGRVVIDHSLESWGNVYNFFGILREHTDISEKEILEISKKFKEGHTGAMLLNLDEKDYYLVYEKSGIQDWVFLGLVQADIVNASMNSLQSSTMLLVGAVVFCIAAFLISLIIQKSRTNLRRKDTEIRYRDELFQKLSMNVDDVFLMLDAKTYQADYVSPNVEKLLGITVEQIHKDICILGKLRSEKQEDPEKNYLEEIQVQEQREWDFEYVHLKTGEKRWFHNIAMGSEVNGKKKYILVMSDRTSDRKMNQALSEAVRAAETANKAKSTFLSNMSHDIRTPMNAIIGFTTLAVSYIDDQKRVRDYLGKILSSSNHLLSLINDVLQMSKLEDENIEISHEPIDLGEISREVGTIISGRTAEAGIAFEIGKQELPVSYVYGSPLHIRQIFLNIYGNCIKYNHPGGTISTKMEQMDVHDKICTYRWTIKDTGIGISKDYIDHIFEPFSQEKTDARSVYQGTGLGMSIVKGLVEQMHGEIKVTSEKGMGSTFVITIPFEIAQKKEQPVAEKIVEQADIRGLNLLVAEDNQLNAEIIQTLLTDDGANVTVVEDGQRAVDQFKNAPQGTFDAILMDIMMPVMDGLTATKEIRSIKRDDAAQIPIIAMTANAFEEDAKKCFAAGMNAHLAKPFQIDKVEKTLVQCIHKSI